VKLPEHENVLFTFI